MVRFAGLTRSEASEKATAGSSPSVAVKPGCAIMLAIGPAGRQAHLRAQATQRRLRREGAYRHCPTGRPTGNIGPAAPAGAIRHALRLRRVSRKKEGRGEPTATPGTSSLDLTSTPIRMFQCVLKSVKLFLTPAGVYS